MSNTRQLQTPSEPLVLMQTTTKVVPLVLYPSHQNFQRLGESVRKAGYTSLLLLALDVFAVTSLTLLEHAWLPQWNTSYYAWNLLFFGLIAYASKRYYLSDSYYAVGKTLLFGVCYWLPHVLLFLSNQTAWTAFCIYSACYWITIGILAWGYHEVTRPFAVPNCKSFFCHLEQGLKRLVDITFALIGLLSLTPVWGILALMIYLSSPGPVFYKSQRMGQGYRPFDMYKFRTMHVHADKLRELLRQQANLQGSLFKLQSDPRVTGVGRFLRAFSLDELPQLLNILRGEMSLVGPRPLPPDESHTHGPYRLRYDVRPGITGLWQVTGRVLDHRRFDAVARYDCHYIDTWCLMSDLRIILKTIPIVLLQKGAC